MFVKEICKNLDKADELQLHHLFNFSDTVFVFPEEYYKNLPKNKMNRKYKNGLEIFLTHISNAS